MTVSGISPDGAKLIGWTTVPVPFAITAVLLRFKSRTLIKQTGPDDWCMLLALVLHLGLYTTSVILAFVGKIGFSRKELSYPQVEQFLRTFWCAQFFYSWVGPAIKMSFLLLYRRIFVVKWFLWATNIVMALVMIWCIGSTFAVIFECSPVGSAWHPLLQHHCIDIRQFFSANAILNLLLDVIIFILPMPMIWRLQLTTRKKISLSVVFALGAFVCATSILRISCLWVIDFDNLPGTTANAAIWTCIESGLGIVCGCLPTLPILVRQVKEHYRLGRTSNPQRLFENKKDFIDNPLKRKGVATNITGGRSPQRQADVDQLTTHISKSVGPHAIHVRNDFSVTWEQA